MKYLYGILCLLGIVLPFTQFIPWITIHGFDVPMLVTEAASTSMSAFAWLDVIVSAVVLLVFIWVEGQRLQMRNLWLPTLGTLTVGVSCGLPLFLLLRQLHIESEQK